MKDAERVLGNAAQAYDNTIKAAGQSYHCIQWPEFSHLVPAKHSTTPKLPGIQSTLSEEECLAEEDNKFPVWECQVDFNNVQTECLRQRSVCLDRACAWCTVFS